ncbi:major facilitator superfamily domain-containing protein [Flammula alnicola]|nr:major facilitator superfamily domain-containing protein [Flammula alnicola]
MGRNDYEALTVVDDPSAGLLREGGNEEVQSGQRTLSKKQETAARAQFYALCWSLFLIGWSDGSTGPLLPRIHQVYNVEFDALSWIFILACSGLVFGALVNMPLGDRFALGKILVLAALFQAAAFAIQSSALPYPLFVVSFAVGGIGIAVQDAQANAFIAIVRNDGEKKMGLLHAAYGLGALVAPLSATQFAQMTHWSYHYLVSLVLAISNASILAIVFRFKDQDTSLIQAGEIIPEKSDVEEGNKYGQLLRLKAVHLLALFLLVYIGVEVTIGGWTVMFMVVVRGGGPLSGYISSGFFGGLTLGRVVLLWVNKKIGEVRVIYVYTVLVIFRSIAVSFIGMLLGPMYPIAISHASRIIPRSLVTGAIGWMTACGAAGSALLPFLTGTMASKFGIGSLQPVLVVMMVLMGAVWAMVPKA